MSKINGLENQEIPPLEDVLHSQSAKSMSSDGHVTN